MNKKTCPACGKDSYSAASPHESWICPHCGIDVCIAEEIEKIRKDIGRLCRKTQDPSLLRMSRDFAPRIQRASEYLGFALDMLEIPAPAKE